MSYSTTTAEIMQTHDLLKIYFKILLTTQHEVLFIDTTGATKKVKRPKRDTKRISDWTSVKGRMCHRNILSNEIKAVIGWLRQRNDVRMWAVVSLGERCVISQKWLRRRLGSALKNQNFRVICPKSKCNWNIIWAVPDVVSNKFYEWYIFQ